jgi:uncharacterized protein (DUF2164 family)
MSDNLKIHTRVRRLFHYIDDFEKGNIRVPAFQRDLVWRTNDKLQLFESIKLGYPIGSILFWRPDFISKEDFVKFEANKMGSYFLPERTQDYFYILDGYQRLSTLLGCLVNPEKTNLKRDDKEWLKEFNIIYNLETDKFEYNKKPNLSELEIFKVPLFRFVDGKEFFDFQKQLLQSDYDKSKIDDYIKKYENFSSNIIDYNIPSIDMIGGNIKEAVDIFSRVNSRGSVIAPDWKVSALSFNKEKGFRLGTEIDDLLKDLKEYNFLKIKRELIFACIKNSFGKIFFDQSKNSTDLEDLATRVEFVDVTRNTIINIKKAVKFLFDDCAVIDSKLLPYSIQLIFITDFFIKIKNPSNEQLKLLKSWFWFTSFTNYFTSNLTQQRFAYNQFQRFLNNETDNPLYFYQPENAWVVSKLLPKVNLGSVRAKSSVLFMLNKIKNNMPFELGEIRGFKTYSLFSEIGEERDNNLVENTIFIINSPNINKNLNISSSTKSLESWLESTEDYSIFFITEEMKRVYSVSKNKNEILKLRRLAIERAEREFVKQFGLDYLPF